MYRLHIKIIKEGLVRYANTICSEIMKTKINLYDLEVFGIDMTCVCGNDEIETYVDEENNYITLICTQCNREESISF